MRGILSFGNAWHLPSTSIIKFTSCYQKYRLKSIDLRAGKNLFKAAMEQQSSCFPYWLRPQTCEMFTNYNSHNEHRKAAGFAATRCGQAVVATSLPEGRSLRRENLQVVYVWQSSSSIRLFACHGGQTKRSYLCIGDFWLLTLSTVKIIFLIYAGS